MEEPMKVIKDWLDPIVRVTLENNKQRKEKGGASLKEDECSFLEFLTDNTEGEPKHLLRLLSWDTEDAMFKMWK
jgi:hypothetical protein